jgi:hypothetical protein
MTVSEMTTGYEIAATDGGREKKTREGGPCAALAADPGLNPARHR